MNLVIYRNDGEVLEVIEDCGEVTYDSKTQTLKYRGGQFWPFKHHFAVLEDDEPINYATLLEHYKQDKIDSLNEECEKTILSGFYCEATGHFYEFSVYDQLNFTQQLLWLVVNPEDSKIIRWKTEDAGTIEHTREEFIAVCNAAEAHKRGNIEQYWTIKERVGQATTFEEVNAIHWTPWEPAREE